jgi:outer membrane lipoprotein-sorting protein
MGPIRVTFLIAAGIISVQTARSAALSAADVAVMEAKYGEHRQIAGAGGWTADFVQTVHSPDLTQPITSSGKIDFESPDALTLKYTAPVAGQVAMVHGKFEQSMPGHEAQASSSDLLQSLVSFFNLPPQAWRVQFAVTATREENLITIHLMAKSGAALTQPATIDEVVDPETLDPVSLEIGFANHASLKFTFSNWQRKETVQPS